MAGTLKIARADAAPFEGSDRFSQFAKYPDPMQEPKTLNWHLLALQPFSKLRGFRRNKTIFVEGDRAEYVYRIETGTVRLCKHVPDGRRHIVDFLLPGDLLGFSECSRQPVTAEAVTEVTLLSFPRARFDRLAAENPVIGTQLLCHLSANLTVAHEHLLVLGCQSAKERIVSFLLRLADRMDVQPGHRLALAMGRRDIADHLGLTIETVCRVIATLRNDGFLLVPDAHQLVLSDMREFRSLAADG